jgi:hypothetical protein
MSKHTKSTSTNLKAKVMVGALELTVGSTVSEAGNESAKYAVTSTGKHLPPLTLEACRSLLEKVVTYEGDSCAFEEKAITVRAEVKGGARTVHPLGLKRFVARVTNGEVTIGIEFRQEEKDGVALDRFRPEVQVSRSNGEGGRGRKAAPTVESLDALGI